MAEDKLIMYYFPIAGRGETARLIAAAGGLEMDVSSEDCGDKSAYGSPGSLPVLKHGDLMMAQSAAIESYLLNIAPKFASLTAKQKAKDMMFCCIKEDLLVGGAKLFFDKTMSPEEKKTFGVAHFDKWFAILEKMCPESGFINGEDFPTAADCAVLNTLMGTMPFGKAFEILGNYDYSTKWPKVKALVDRTAEAPGIKEYLAETKSMTGTF